MKRLVLISSLLLGASSLSFAKSSSNSLRVVADENYVIATNGCSAKSLPNKLDLNPCSEEDIRDYYSSLNTLDDSKKSGIDVLQYIKPILFEMNYYTYAAVSDIYAITDRDWTNSPTLTSGTYNSETNIVTDFSNSAEADSNPYIKMLYVDYTKVDKTPLLDGTTANFDKEHVWCQSRGFKDSPAAGPAGTDLHHLIAGDSYVNRSIHNNNPYGFVDVVDKNGDLTFTGDNKKGSIKHTSTSDESSVVFEPCDSSKGDVARAIFYMMARYNNVSGTDEITNTEPNLQIVNYASSSGNAIYSSQTEPATMGILSDLLAWNKLDPVDEFEIYRNDLIYRNYQGNRNPFIDFPQWIDAIWGTADDDGTNYSSTTVGKVNPATDVINGSNDFIKFSSSKLTIEEGKTATLKVTEASISSTINWSVSDSSIISIDKTTSSIGEDITITALKEGTTDLVATIREAEQQVTKTVKIVVEKAPKELTIKDYIIYALIALGVLILSLIITSLKKKAKKQVKKVVKQINNVTSPTTKTSSTKKTTTPSKKTTSSTKKSTSAAKKTTKN